MDIGCRAIGYLFRGEKGLTLPTYPPSLQLLLLTFQPNPDTRPATPEYCPISNRNHCPICPGFGVRFGLESVSELNWNRCPNWPGVRTLLLDGVTTGLKFDHQRILIELLIQARLEFIQNRHGHANDFLGEFLVFHKQKTDHGWHG